MTTEPLVDEPRRYVGTDGSKGADARSPLVIEGQRDVGAAGHPERQRRPNRIGAGHDGEDPHERADQIANSRGAPLGAEGSAPPRGRPPCALVAPEPTAERERAACFFGRPAAGGRLDEPSAAAPVSTETGGDAGMAGALSTSDETLTSSTLISLVILSLTRPARPPLVGARMSTPPRSHSAARRSVGPACARSRGP